MNPRNPAIIRKYFIGSAARYERDIVPAFRQFAASVIETAAPQGHEITLDIGTGTGILARLIAPQVRRVIGVDLIVEMLTPSLPSPAGRGGNKEIHAGRGGSKEIHASRGEYGEIPPNWGKNKEIPANRGENNAPPVDGGSWSGVAADAHELPFRHAAFDLAVASFGLNATEPRPIFREIRRVLKPGGVLAFHEWSVLHPLDEQISAIIATYMLPDDEVSEDHFAMREFIRSVRPWDNLLQDREDFEDVLSTAGFSAIQVWEDQPVLCQLPIADFLAYKLGWANRAAELAAMDEWTRGDCLDALRAMLQKEADSDGIIHYDPQLFRVRAQTLSYMSHPEVGREA